MSQHYHGVILDAEFKNPRFVDRFQIFAKRRSRSNPWILYGVAVEPSKIEEIFCQIQENLKIDAPYYAHFYRDGELIVVFKEKVFRITQDKSTWADAQKYGRSLGIPKEQLNFFCVSFDKEKEYWGEEDFINQEPHIHNFVVCANIFVRKDGKYLLLKRSPHKKFAPNFVHPIGGKMDADENPYLGVQRELREEAGMTVKNIRLEAVILEVFPYKRMPGVNWLIFYFSADYKSGKLKQSEEGELIWLTSEEILSKSDQLFPSVRQVIKHILNPIDGTVFATFEYNDNSEIAESTNKIDVCVA